MNKLGIHALVWVGGWSQPEARHAVEQTASAGYDLIEIPVLSPASVDAAMTRELLEEHGLEATCSLGLRFDADVSSRDPEIVRRGEDLLDGALAVAREVGSPYLGGVLYSALGKYAAPLSEPGRRNCVTALRRLAQKAADAGITIGLEVVNRYETNVVNTTEQALVLLDEVDADNVVVHLDTYHMNIEEPDLATPVRQAGSRLGYVHVGESHRGYLGTGTVDFPAFFAALAEHRYDGVVTFESFSSAVVNPQLSSSLAVWRDLWSDGRDLARHARTFVAAGLAAGD
ncbi:MAG: sugar phosphate isomerase/epimerase [Streptosporangiales bacterium]|nr:sugar phosphate isomerase/epimerase [Streptosporangiales bacterium]MBO0889571.1 sugar phosphate isomerase/epimerase [Acidothermales bacterium]